MMKRAKLKHYEMSEGDNDLKEKHWNSIGEKKEIGLNEIPAVFINDRGAMGRSSFGVLLYDDDDLKCILSYNTEEEAKKSMKNWEENGMVDKHKWKEYAPT